jgi:4-hydroxybenzoate polyprenyltransferase
MSGSQAAERYVPAPFAAADADPAVGARSGRLAALSWAGLASTLHRLRGGEGALLAVNFSLLAYWAPTPARALSQALVSVLAIGLMYAFNDVYDAPSDWKNPKKDRTVTATYIEHRRPGTIAILVLKLLTVALSLALLGPAAAAAVAAVMSVNLVYSIWLKGVPVVDVAWCGLWGALYAAIVTTSGTLLVLVGLMTAVCHLFQALDDRAPDAANGIVTTAVRSPALSRDVLIALSGLLFVALYAHVGMALAATAFTPLAFFFTARTPRTAWLLTKAYFAVMWLYMLGVTGAAG